MHLGDTVCMRNLMLTNLIILSALLQACNNNGVGNRNILQVVNSAEPATLDLHKATGQPEFRILGALFEGLVTRKEGGRIEPGLAHSWVVSEDGLTYTFHLRPAFWSDGSPLSSRDFLLSWRRFVDPKTASEYSALLGSVSGGNRIRSGSLSPDSLGVSAPDDSTFVVNLEHPVGFFLQLCAFEPLFPIPVAIAEKFQEAWTQPGNIVGNGPFRMKKWERNRELVVEKNPYYWDSSAVRQPLISFKPVEDALTSYNMFLTGEADWIFNIPPSKLEAAALRPEYYTRPMFGTYYFSVNCTKPGFDSPSLRKALSYAIDRKKIVDHVLKGGQIPATGFLPPLEGYASIGLKLYDPEKARMYLRESGFGPENPPKGLQILFNNSETHKSVAEVVRQMWKETLGLETELVNYEWKVYLDNTRNLTYSSVARSSWIGDYADPSTFLELGVSDNGNNRTGYKNPVYDSLLAVSWTTQEPEKRMRQLLEAEKILMEDMPVIPIYYYTINELRNPALQGAQADPLGMYAWKRVFLDPAAGGRN